MAKQEIFTLAVLSIFAILLSSLASALAGSGTAQDPYNISSCIDLNRTRDNMTAYYQLTRDIGCINTTYWDSGKGFFPIGNSTNKFYGNLNGNGYAIQNFVINRSSLDNTGLFGWTTGAMISNVYLSDVNITGRAGTGALIGFADNSNVSNSSSTGIIYGYASVGGLVGYAQYVTVSNSYSDCGVSGQVFDAGGLVGYLYVSSILNSYSTGNVSGSNAGGLVGRSAEYALAEYENFTQIDYPSTISKSYATGNVYGGDAAGGLVGVDDSYCDLGCVYLSCSASFWDNETSGQTTDACPSGSTGNTTANIRSLSTFTVAGWNFTDTWGLSTTLNNGFPYLKEFYKARYTTFTGTNLNSFQDITNITSPQLTKSGSTVAWNNNINAARANFDVNTAFGSNFVSIDASKFDSSINSSANVTITVPSCSNFVLYYSSGYYASAEDIKAHGTLVATQSYAGGNCTDSSICSNVGCSGNSLTFTAMHFDGYGGGGGPAVPEFSTLTTIIALAIVLSGFFIMRNRKR